MTSKRRQSGDGCTAGERGAVSVWILIMLPVLVLFLGVTWDAGNLLALQREADNAASSAARAGAQVVDQETLYNLSSGGGDGRVGLNVADARAQAIQVAEAGGGSSVGVRFDMTSTSSAAFDLITVSMERQYSPTFLSLFGTNSITVTGEATVRVRGAVERNVFDNRTYLDQQNG